MTVSFKFLTTSQGFQAIGTYNVSNVESFVYATGKTDSGYIDLEAFRLRPTNVSSGVAVPLIIVFSGGGFDSVAVDETTSPPMQYHHLTLWEDLASAGAVVVAPYYRTSTNAPRTDNDGASDTLKKRACRAAMLYDQPACIRYMLNSAQVNSNAIDRRRVFFVGWSAGGQSAIKQAITFGTSVCKGVVGFTCGLGLTTSLYSPPSSMDHSADIRSFIVETDITASTPPIQAFLTGDDTIIGGTYNADLRSRLQALSSQHPEPQWKANGTPSVGGHDGPAEWGNWTYSGNSVSTMEGIRRWFNDLMVGVPAALTGVSVSIS